MGLKHQDNASRGTERPTVSLPEIREKLASADGQEYWRSLEEVADTEEFRQMLHREFPRQASEWPDGVSRRGFLELSAASLALAGLTACTRQPAEQIVPYVRLPEELVPGRPFFYATSMEVSGYGVGLLVESHMGRPTKVDGNPDHPASLGASDVLAQASVLGLYDPDRSQSLTHLEKAATWSDFAQAMAARIKALTALGGEGLRVLTGTVGSPTLAAQLAGLQAKLPKARWHQYEPLGRHAARAAAQAAFGTYADTRFELSKANVIVALDADFLNEGPARVRYAREFARRRKAWQKDGQAMNRLYSVESSPTVTASQADHRLALTPQGVGAFAASLAAALGVPGAAALELSAFGQAATWVKSVAADLQANRGASLVVAGEQAPAELHVLAHAMNQALGNVGSTVIHTEPVEARPENQLESIRSLVDDMKAGRVDTLLILGGNPVFDAPSELGFGEALLKVVNSVHLSLYKDETSERCRWHIPAVHYLESWGDSRAFDGTISPIQPLIAPLWAGTRSAHEILALFGDTTDATPYELVRGEWQKSLLASAGAGFEAAWRRALHDGLLTGSALPAKAVTVSAEAVGQAVEALRSAPAGGMALVLRADPNFYDGRFANNGWLMELPRPLTKLTWDNALLLSPRDAEKLGVETESRVAVALGERKLEVPVFVLPGTPEGAATIHLGWGRRRLGKVGGGVGVDAYALRTSGQLSWAAGATLSKASGRTRLATTQTHHDMELQTREAGKRHLLRRGTVTEFQENPTFAQKMGHGAPPAEESMYDAGEHPYPGNAWGLAVDLSSCIGCNACVIACQAENNISVVGKEQVLVTREMHWIRIDRYYHGSLDDPSVHFQPVMCQQCEQAPCEVVCPVAATSHSPEGLNEMTYNRCVGTRYCSNNCPYKVRRFNFLLFSDFETEVLKMQRNPDVSIRSRGVMEKCTYCVQRINLARIEAKKENRPIADGEVVTACQQACPTEAIAFGNINDPQAKVTRWKASELNYGLLEDLGTRPRTTYLAKLTNPNPVLAALSPAGEGEGEH